MKAFYVFVAIAVIVASVAAMEEEEEELFQMLEKRSLDSEELEQMIYGSEPMVKRGRFKFCNNAQGDQCICDRRFRNANRRRYVNCVPKNKGTPV